MQNLLVFPAISTSYIAFGSIRMEPVFMILGRSAGNLALLSVEESKDIHEIKYEALQAKLINFGHI